MSIFSKIVNGYKRLLDEGQKSEWATAEITEYGIFNVPEELKESARKKVGAFEATMPNQDSALGVITSLLANSDSKTSDWRDGMQIDGYYENGIKVYDYED